jgi:hypothetical protein
MDRISGMGQISSSTSEFDNSNIIELSMSRVDGTKAEPIPKTSIGAKWIENDPSTIYIKLNQSSDARQSNSYTLFEKIRVNLNGEITTFEVPNRTVLSSSDYNDVSNTIYTKSVALVPIDISYIRKMLDSENCKIRVSTFDGYEDLTFDTEARNGFKFARANLKEFMLEVDANLNIL